MSTVIKVENVGKQYRLGQVGTGTIAHDLNRWWARMRGKEDPFLKIGETNDRTSRGESDYVWALRDINFEVKQGEVLGIIGKNGAGKSTLLKILSQVTTPTIGQVKVKGRIASLLEVGTGFNPELSGRDNVFLNGAILGMTRQEIKSRFDEIVDFSGVERYIDTPVKRYSSGMYVRLAFAVAAHLEPEILIVDEVLAVGDAEFQKKCLGKMKDVSGQGRTILFVSHQLGMINTLCTKGVVLKHGQTDFSGTASEAVDYYVNSTGATRQKTTMAVMPEKPDQKAQILSCRLLDKDNNEKAVFDVFEPVFLEFKCVLRQPVTAMNICWSLERNGEFLISSFDTDKAPERLDRREAGWYTHRTKLPTPLKGGVYTLSSLSLGIANVGAFDVNENMLKFEIEENSFDPTYKSYSMNRRGFLVANEDWEETAYSPLS